MKRVVLALAVAVSGLLFVTADAQAQEMSASGYAAYMQTGATTTALGEGRTRVDQTSDGYVMTDDPASPFHLMAQDCAGTNLIAADGTLERASGYCAARDADGDMYWFWYWNGPAGSEWGLIGGTGKFDGITGGGTSEAVAADPDGRSVVRWEGTWTM